MQENLHEIVNEEDISPAPSEPEENVRELTIDYQVKLALIAHNLLEQRRRRTAQIEKKEREEQQAEVKEQSAKTQDIAAFISLFAFLLFPACLPIGLIFAHFLQRRSYLIQESRIAGQLMGYQALSDTPSL